MSLPNFYKDESIKRYKTGWRAGTLYQRQHFYILTQFQFWQLEGHGGQKKDVVSYSLSPQKGMQKLRRNMPYQKMETMQVYQTSRFPCGCIHFIPSWLVEVRLTCLRGSFSCKTSSWLFIRRVKFTILCLQMLQHWAEETGYVPATDTHAFC